MIGDIFGASVFYMWTQGDRVGIFALALRVLEESVPTEGHGATGSFNGCRMWDSVLRHQYPLIARNVLSWPTIHYEGRPVSLTNDLKTVIEARALDVQRITLGSDSAVTAERPSLGQTPSSASSVMHDISSAPLAATGSASLPRRNRDESSGPVVFESFGGDGARGSEADGGMSMEDLHQRRLAQFAITAHDAHEGRT
jgi:hypothetical protein